MVEVCKPDGEETIARTRVNDEDAPTAAIRGTEIDRQGSTLSRHSARRRIREYSKVRNFHEWPMCDFRNQYDPELAYAKHGRRYPATTDDRG
jgi:hypothetical protein